MGTQLKTRATFIALLAWGTNLILLQDTLIPILTVPTYIGYIVSSRFFQTYDFLTLLISIFLSFNVRSFSRNFNPVFQEYVYYTVAILSSFALVFYSFNFILFNNFYLTHNLYHLGLLNIGILLALTIISFSFCYSLNQLLPSPITDPLGVLDDEDRTRKKAKKEVPPIP